jgi:hypothetical protein
MNAGTSTQQHQTNLVSDFYGGLSVLTMLGGRTSETLSREAMLDPFAAFEAAVGPLAELQAAGKLQGLVSLSAETRERIGRIGMLLRLAPDGADAPDAAAEIRALAEQSLRELSKPP